MTEVQTSQPEKRRPDTVVTSENLAEYQKHKLDIAETVAPVVEKKEEVKVEPEAKQESLEIEAPEQVEKVETNEADENKKVLKKANSKIETRFSELTHQRDEAKARAEAAERRAAELEAKLKPIPEKAAEENEKPDKSKYTDAFQYAEDLAVWSAKNALREKEESDRRARAEFEASERLNAWNRRLEETKKENPEFIDKVANSTVQVSAEVRDAIMDSDIGPKILLHFAENPEEAEKIGKMTVGKALIMLGKIEAKLTETPKKEEPKVETKDEVLPEVSKAPIPITPLKGASASVDLPINSRGEWTGTHEQYVAARRAGKIK